jgi:hypothetical protein
MLTWRIDMDKYIFISIMNRFKESYGENYMPLFMLDQWVNTFRWNINEDILNKAVDLSLGEYKKMPSKSQFEKMIKLAKKKISYIDELNKPKNPHLLPDDYKSVFTKEEVDEHFKTLKAALDGEVPKEYLKTYCEAIKETMRQRKKYNCEECLDTGETFIYHDNDTPERVNCKLCS